ncbi:F-box/RNI-like superfamily protein [Striga asiatica]|uniref:F-box/RNI-like superfamily protein n=1 Tax=Striga asiatica TaxID=4170 RepID=A0A5A7PT46_STRAF|nr:F-box/RNI-like superfamily protein [Striga asiatica]
MMGHTVSSSPDHGLPKLTVINLPNRHPTLDEMWVSFTRSPGEGSHCACEVLLVLVNYDRVTSSLYDPSLRRWLPDQNFRGKIYCFIKKRYLRDRPTVRIIDIGGQLREANMVSSVLREDKFIGFVV